MLVMALSVNVDFHGSRAVFSMANNALCVCVCMCVNVVVAIELSSKL